MNDAIGLVVALNAEARALVGRGPWEHAEGVVFRRFRLPDSTTLIVVRSGMGSENAATASRWLIQEGVSALGVSGVSGGLAPELMPGDLILADAVMAEGADGCRQVWNEDAGFVERAYSALMHRGMPAHRGSIIGVQAPVLSIEDRRTLFAKSKALAADMESAAAALIADTARLPFFAFRAVCDPACRSVSRDLFQCLDQKTRLRPFHILKTVLTKPAFVSELLQMRRDFAAALTGLRRAWVSGIRDMLPSLLS